MPASNGAPTGRHARANRWDLWAVDLVHNMAYERESELHQIVATLAAAARSSNSHLLLVVQFNEAPKQTPINKGDRARQDVKTAAVQ